jgi:hypothetical protein
MREIKFTFVLESVMFNLRFKIAMGLVSISKVSFSSATLFDFQNRVFEYELQTEINLR